jgi:hypothetical protein
VIIKNIYYLLFVFMCAINSVLAHGDTPKTDLLLSTAAEFSGAIDWAHETGVRGQNIYGAVVEYGDVILEELHLLGITTDKVIKTDHSKNVKHLMHEVAPESKLKTVLLNRWYDVEAALDLYWIKEKIKHKKVVNYSMGRSLMTKKENWPAYIAQHESLFQALSYGKDKVVICAAGNDTHNFSKTYLTKTNIPDNIILAGALTQRSGIASFSNRPGRQKKLQDRTLFTLGDGVIVRPFTPKQQTIVGTSYAAPIISGAALLVYSAYPQFKAKDVTEVLLESAERSFFQRSNTDHGYAEYYYYDPEDEPLSADHMGPHVLVRPFDPAIMGKGILSIRNALIYAKIKATNPGASPKQLRKAMKKVLAKENNAAATKIQRYFKERRAKKKAMAERT